MNDPRINRLVFAGLELLAAQRGLTPAETRAHADLANRLERANAIAEISRLTRNLAAR